MTTGPMLLEAARMPLMKHLAEFRTRLRNAVIILVIAFIGCYPLRHRINAWLAKPLVDALYPAYQKGWVGRIIFTKPTEMVLVGFQIAAVSALFVSSPFIFYQLWRFISPGLHPRERRWTLPLVLIAAGLFVGGGLFCYYFVLPASYQFFLNAGYEAMLAQKQIAVGKLPMESLLQPTIGMDEFLGLTLFLLVVFGLVFELPLVLAVLSILGVVSARALWRFNRYAIVIFAVVGAVLTPGDVVVGQLFMVVALVILYNASIGLAWLVQRKRQESTTTLSKTKS